MGTRGMTLLEVVIAVAIFTIVMGVIYTIGLGFVNASEMQEIVITTNTEARRALMVLSPRLRQASRMSINWVDLPGDSITFMLADDVNGNGFAVDETGRIELVGPVTIQRDGDDANGDGMTMSQLVMIMGDTVQVLANDLMEEVVVDDGLPGAPAGAGFWVEPRGRGLEVTIRALGRTVRGMQYDTVMTEFIVPRN